MIINPNSITTEGDRILHTGNTHANLHAEDGSDPITPASIGAETPAGAQAKVDTHEAKAAPHSGHETPAGAQSKVDTHENKKTTHGLGSGYYLAKTSRSDQLPTWGDIQGKPSTFSPSSHSHPWSEVTEKPSSYTPSSHNNSHASGGSDPITPASIGAETPAGAQAKADAAESAAKSYTDTHENKTSTHGATPAATPNRIIMRATNGTAKVAPPVEADDIARKAEVDALKTQIEDGTVVANRATHASTASKATYAKAIEIDDYEGIQPLQMLVTYIARDEIILNTENWTTLVKYPIAVTPGRKVEIRCSGYYFESADETDAQIQIAPNVIGLSESQPLQIILEPEGTYVYKHEEVIGYTQGEDILYGTVDLSMKSLDAEYPGTLKPGDTIWFEIEVKPIG